MPPLKFRMRSYYYLLDLLQTRSRECMIEDLHLAATGVAPDVDDNQIRVVLLQVDMFFDITPEVIYCCQVVSHLLGAIVRKVL